MREIRFRAWEKDEKKYYDLDKLFNNDFEKIMYLHPTFIVGKGNIVFEQYTGIKDKNNKELYENDFIKNLEYISFDHGGHVQKDGVVLIENIRDNTIDYLEEFEIIGNLWQNPELLSQI